MDKETANIQEIQSYVETKSNVKHLSKPYSVFNADVLYEDHKHGNIFLKNVQVMWQHGFINDIAIAELQPPYYGDFNCRFQNFKYINGNLVITGLHHDDPNIQYRVTLI